MGYNEQRFHFEVYHGWGLRSLGNPVLLLFFSFSLLPSLAVLFTTPNSPVFSLLYWPGMSTPWHPPPLQTAKLKLLDLAALRTHPAALIPQQKGQIWGPKPDSLHCLAANLHLLSFRLTASYQRKNLTYYQPVFSK